MSCAALRLARFNVSNEHGEQHHFSFLGLPSPGAAGAVAAFVLMQQELLIDSTRYVSLQPVARVCIWLLPGVVLVTGLLMVSNIRYPHLVNRYLRGKRSVARILLFLVVGLLIIIAHRYTLAAATLTYALWGPAAIASHRMRPKPPLPAPQA
jgi:CDP-diacylglycerol--serine O-phosphatidyltransferase